MMSQALVSRQYEKGSAEKKTTTMGNVRHCIALCVEPCTSGGWRTETE